VERSVRDARPRGTGAAGQRYVTVAVRGYRCTGPVGVA
jgi:hypothetical protein